MFYLRVLSVCGRFVRGWQKREIADSLKVDYSARGASGVSSQVRRFDQGAEKAGGRGVGTGVHACPCVACLQNIRALLIAHLFWIGGSDTVRAVPFVQQVLLVCLIESPQQSV